MSCRELDDTSPELFIIGPMGRYPNVSDVGRPLGENVHSAAQYETVLDPPMLIFADIGQPYGGYPPASPVDCTEVMLFVPLPNPNPTPCV